MFLHSRKKFECPLNYNAILCIIKKKKTKTKKTAMVICINFLIIIVLGSFFLFFFFLHIGSDVAAKIAGSIFFFHMEIST